VPEPSLVVLVKHPMSFWVSYSSLNAFTGGLRTIGSDISEVIGKNKGKENGTCLSQGGAHSRLDSVGSDA
jgi:hypothetical protein